MRGAFAGLIAVGALYLTIWPHELGHAVTAYAYGCKASWWQTGVSWYLWSSWGGDIDYRCLRSIGGGAAAAVDFAGIGVNLLLLAMCPIIGQWGRLDPASSPRWHLWLFLGTFWWSLANYAEAFSYLVLNTLWLKSDTRTVVMESGIGRWAWLGGGVALATLVGWALREPARRAAVIVSGNDPPTRMSRYLFPGYVVLVGGVMAAARMVLT